MRRPRPACPERAPLVRGLTPSPFSPREWHPFATFIVGKPLKRPNRTGPSVTGMAKVCVGFILQGSVSRKASFQLPPLVAVASAKYITHISFANVRASMAIPPTMTIAPKRHYRDGQSLCPVHSRFIRAKPRIVIALTDTGPAGRRECGGLVRRAPNVPHW